MASRVLRLLRTDRDVRAAQPPAPTVRCRAPGPAEDDHVGVGAAHPAAGPAGGPRAARATPPTTSLPLSGTGDGEHDAGLLLALTSLRRTPVRAASARTAATRPPQHSMGPAALREARRGHAAGRRSWACRWSRSSTPPAPTSRREAEEGALAGEIARCLADMSRLTRADRVPCCSARAAAAARSPCCPPTGSSPRSTPGSRRCRRRAPARSCYHDIDHAAEMAERQRVARARPARRRHRPRGRARAARRPRGPGRRSSAGS